jgi:hypothetical protein
MQIYVIVAASLVIVVIEIFLRSTWNKYYFSIGLPVFVRRAPASPPSTIPPDIRYLKAEFRSTLSGTLEFRDINWNEYGFREKLMVRIFTIGHRRIVPEVMHGYLKYDYGRKQVVVKGFLNWWTVLLPLWFLVISNPMIKDDSPFSTVIAIVICLVIPGISYVSQLYLFNKIATSAAELWSHPFSLPTV